MHTEEKQKVQEAEMASAAEQIRMMRNIVLDKDTLSKQLPLAIKDADETTASELAVALRPTVAEGLRREVIENRDSLVESLWPVILPAVRMSVRQMMAQMMESTNQILESSLSLTGWRWRLEAWRTKRSFAEVAMKHSLIYQAEQVFLIQSDSGILMRHLADEDTGVRDPDLVSGMLTAIREFVRDSFDAKENEGLSQFRVGDYTIMVEQSPATLLALAIRGNPNAACRERMQDVIERLQVEHGDALAAYQGDERSLADIDPILSTCLHTEQRRQKQGSRTLRFVGLGLAAILLTCFVIYVKNKLHRSAVEREVEAFRQAPGLIITQTKWIDGTLVVHGSHDPVGFSIRQAAAGAGERAEHIDWQLNRHVSLDAAVVLARLSTSLNPPPGVTLKVQGSHLVLEGSASDEWRRYAVSLARQDPGIASVDSRGVEP